MFFFGPMELLIVAIVAIVVAGLAAGLFVLVRVASGGGKSK